MTIPSNMEAKATFAGLFIGYLNFVIHSSMLSFFVSVVAAFFIGGASYAGQKAFKKIESYWKANNLNDRMIKFLLSKFKNK